MAGMLTSASRSALPGMMVSWFVLSVLACSPLPVADGKWRGLTIAPEDRCSPYLASDYRYPPSVEPQIAARLRGIRSKYTGRVFHSLEETDIEHIVARSEAHDSGLDAGAEPLLVCTLGGQGEAQVRADGGLARDASPGRGARQLRRWID